jgi:hypothetical protein
MRVCVYIKSNKLIIIYVNKQRNYKTIIKKTRKNKRWM